VEGDDPLTPEEKKEKRKRKRETIDSLEPALTDTESVAPDATNARSPWSVDVLPAYAMASYVDPESESFDIHCCTGPALSINVGHAFDSVKTVGFHGGIGALRGYRKYKRGIFMGEFDTELLPIDLGFFARFEKSRLWASVWLGVHIDRLYDEHADVTMPSLVQWSKSLGLGIQGGLDLLRFGRYRIAAAGEIDGAPGAKSGYGALWLGLALRAAL
jgi:hypothetical protein